MGVQRKIRTVLLIAGALAASAKTRAQVQVGDDVLLNLNGSLATGYSGSSGDAIPSGHGFTIGGNADLSGSYYSPNFLSFHVNPFLNQSRETSNAQSITSTSGVNANASIFSGSHYPGWVNFSDTFNSTGRYAVPGLPDYVAHGNSRMFGVGWSEIKPDWPMVSASYQQGGSDYSIFGTDSTSQIHSKSFNLTAMDMLNGFQLTGNFHYSKSHSTFPQIVSTQVEQRFDSDNTSFGLGASHKLPWRGMGSAHFGQSGYSYDATRLHSSGTVRTVDAYASMNPTHKLSLDGNTYYTDNLIGTLYQTIVNAGGGLLLATPGRGTSAFSVVGNAVYAINDSLRVTGRADHRQQTTGRGTFGSNSYGGVVSYFHMVFGGRFGATQTVSENVLNYNHQSALGLNSSLSYSRSIGVWNAAGNFNFYQNQQTLLVTYTSSGYSYGATLGRRVKWSSYFNLGASGSKSLYNDQSGTGFFNQTYTAALTTRRIGGSASYTKSRGNGILTGTGVVPAPIPGQILPVGMLLYGGESYSYGLGGSPIRRLSFSTSYVRTRSDTQGALGASGNKSELANIYLYYSFRKLAFNAGYSRILQGFSASGVPPVSANSYYAGISRWFNFF